MKVKSVNLEIIDLSLLRIEFHIDRFEAPVNNNSALLIILLADLINSGQQSFHHLFVLFVQLSVIPVQI